MLIQTNPFLNCLEKWFSQHVYSGLHAYCFLLKCPPDIVIRDHTLIRVTRVINLLHASIGSLMSLFFDGKYSSYMLIRQMCVRYNMKK